MIPVQIIRYFIRPAAAGLRADMRGTAAIEFSLILPLMLSLFIGTVEFYNAIAIDRKVTLMARTCPILYRRAQEPPIWTSPISLRWGQRC